MSDEISFSSKTDIGLLILILGVVAICVWVLGEYWQQILSGDWVLGLVLLPGIVLPLWILMSLRYFLSDSALRIRCGPFRWKISISEITEIEPTSSIFSGPALSLDRIRIKYGSGHSVLISPEPRKEFLKQLEFRRREASA